MGSNLSDLDPGQVLQDAHVPATSSIRVTGTGGSGQVVVTATSPLPVTLAGSSNLDILAHYNIPFSSLTTSYFQVDAATTDDFSKVAVYDTSGETIELAIGASGSEVVKMLIGPGNDQVLEIQVPAGSRLAVRTVGSNATGGSLILNFLGAV